MLYKMAHNEIVLDPNLYLIPQPSKNTRTQKFQQLIPGSEHLNLIKFVYI